MKNLEKYKDDLDQLIRLGHQLLHAMRYECKTDQFVESVKQQLGEKTSRFLKSLPSFKIEYQIWYSEATAIVRQLLPDRLDDFTGYYEKPSGRKNVTYETYRISDYLLGLEVTDTGSFGATIVSPDAAIPRFEQQLAIMKAVKSRFESSLFDIRQIVQADLLDSELEAADLLVKHGFVRAGGAIAGVVMEKHLSQVCENHSIKIRKKNPKISDFNERLKAAEVIDTPQWRSNQFLADIRNQCDHNRKYEPTMERVSELVEGVRKLTKTLY